MRTTPVATPVRATPSPNLRFPELLGQRGLAALAVIIVHSYQYDRSGPTARYPLQDSWVAVLEQALTDPSAARVAWEEANKLVGSLDSYGRTGGSSLARRASELLHDWPPDLEEPRNVIADLRRLLDRP